MSNPDSGKNPKNSDPRPQLGEEEEVAHYDDAVIGRAFRISLVAFVLLVAGAGAAYIFLTRTKAAPPPQVTKLAAPAQQRPPSVELPAARFTEVTAAAGIKFAHNNGAYGDKLLPETMGSGVAFFDADNDGDQDLLFINSTYWPGHIPAGQKPPTAAFYLNDGKGNFTDATAGSGLDVSMYGMGVAVGDFNNDGWEDVFITGVGENRLFQNLGGHKFKEVTAAMGLSSEPNVWSTTAAWVDYDNDGYLDLFVGRYVRWSKEIDLEVGYKLVGVGRAYGPPMNFSGTFSALYHNEAGRGFKDVSESAGIQVKNRDTGVPMGKALGVAPVDVDNDGWIDLVVANDTVQNFLFHNEGNGKFKEIGGISGIAFDSFGATRGAMGIDVAYYRNDASLGIGIGNFANEMTALYVAQNGAKVFTDEAITEGLGPASRLLLKFGIFFFDYDLDGRLDVLTSNGHLEEEINKVQQSQHYAQPAQLFWNAGASQQTTFLAVPADKAGNDLFRPIVGRGSAYADIDGDGDLDVVLTQTGGKPLLLRNDQQLNHHWVRLNLRGTASNRSAIGATVKLTLNGQTVRRMVTPTRSYLSQSELPITIGLGATDKIDSLEIKWPNGQVQTVTPVPIDKPITVDQSAKP